MLADPRVVSLDLPGGALECRVVRTRARRPALQVRADLAVELRVPARASLERVLAWAHTHGAWLERARTRLARQPAPLRFGPDAPHHVAGRALPLRVRTGAQRVEQTGHALVVVVPDPHDAPAIEAALAAYYRAIALRTLPARLAELAARLPWRCSPAPPRLRLMRGRWGSCRRDGLITLSTLLARAAPASADYVMVHELCHLRAFHHGPAFRALLEQAFPHWREARAALEALPPWPAPIRPT